MKKYWRCFVCNDIHFGIRPPDTCPTCMVSNAYVEIASSEARTIMEQTQIEFDKEKFKESIASFASENEFRVNPDRERVRTLMEGIFNNEKNHGLKYCPCRLTTKEFAEDLKIVCPCNFLIHETYKDNPDGKCWCGLFIKENK